MSSIFSLNWYVFGISIWLCITNLIGVHHWSLTDLFPEIIILYNILRYVFTISDTITTVDGCEILHHQKDGFSSQTKSWDVKPIWKNYEKRWYRWPIKAVFSTFSSFTSDIFNPDPACRRLIHALLHVGHVIRYIIKVVLLIRSTQFANAIREKPRSWYVNMALGESHIQVIWIYIYIICIYI